MARNTEQVIRDLIGGQTIQIASLIAQLEAANEELAALKSKPSTGP